MFIERSNLIELICQSLPPNEASIMAGMLIGEKGLLSSEMVSVFKKSGLMHLLITSGSNVMLLGSVLIEGLSGYLGRKKAIILGLSVVLGYGLLCGLEAPLVRAILLFGILYGAQVLGRKFNMIRAIILVCLLTAAADWETFVSLSFAMSMSAFVGVWSSRFIKNKGIGAEMLKMIWVSLWVWPLTIFINPKINLLSPINNLLVLAVSEISTMIGFLFLVISWWEEVSRLVLMSSWPFLHFLSVMALAGARWGWEVELKIGRIGIIGIYIFLAGVLRLLEEKTKYER